MVNYDDYQRWHASAYMSDMRPCGKFMKILCLLCVALKHARNWIREKWRMERFVCGVRRKTWIEAARKLCHQILQWVSQPLRKHNCGLDWAHKFTGVYRIALARPLIKIKIYASCMMGKLHPMGLTSLYASVILTTIRKFSATLLSTADMRLAGKVSICIHKALSTARCGWREICHWFSPTLYRDFECNKIRSSERVELTMVFYVNWFFGQHLAVW